jgi:hypothetical protein
MCRFYFYELIWSVYLYIVYVVKIKRFKLKIFSPQNPPLPAVTFQTEVSEEWGSGEWTHMCRFYFYELIWSVYLYIVYVVKIKKI